MTDNFNPKSTSNLVQISIILLGIIIFVTPIHLRSESSISLAGNEEVTNLVGNDDDDMKLDLKFYQHDFVNYF